MDEDTHERQKETTKQKTALRQSSVTSSDKTPTAARDLELRSEWKRHPINININYVQPSVQLLLMGGGGVEGTPTLLGSLLTRLLGIRKVIMTCS